MPASPCPSPWPPLRPRPFRAQLLATDGLWDVMGSEEAVDFVERYKACRQEGLSCAEALTLEAQERWKAQNEEVRRRGGRPVCVQAEWMCSGRGYCCRCRC